MSIRPVVMAPSFPRRDLAADGQSIYVVQSAQALARALGCTEEQPLLAIALRLGAELSRERDGVVEIVRVELPEGLVIEGPFALYDATHFEPAMMQLATLGLHFVPRDAPVLVHGYELGPAAKRLAAQGNRVVAVLHYLLAQESEHYLASAVDPLRYQAMKPLFGVLGRLLPARLRAPLVRTVTRAAAWSLGGKGVLAHQLVKLAHERMLMEAADLAIGVSRGFASAMARAYPETRITHCHAGAPDEKGVPPDVDRRHERHATHRLRFVSVGRPTPQKGWDVLAAALHCLERERPALAERIEVTLIGGVEVVSEAHSLFVRSTMQRLSRLTKVQVTLLGRLSHREVLRALEEADVFLFPSDYEPFGLVLVEAMQRGKPVLAFDADGPRDVVTPESGWLVSRGAWRGRPERLAEAMASLFSVEHEMLERMGAAARARAGEFTWQACAAVHRRALGV